MNRREQRTVSLAIAILRRAAGDYQAKAPSEGVQLALRVLLPHVDRHTLSSFWTVSSNPNPAQRVHLLRKVFSQIELSALRSLSNTKPHNSSEMVSHISLG